MPHHRFNEVIQQKQQSKAHSMVFSSLGVWLFGIEINLLIEYEKCVGLSLIVTCLQFSMNRPCTKHYRWAWNESPLSAWLAQQGRKQRKTRYSQIRAETLVPGNAKEGPRAAPSQKIRTVNGLSMWTWIKTPMRCWKSPDHKFPVDQEVRVGALMKILCTRWGYKGPGFSLFRVPVQGHTAQATINHLCFKPSVWPLWYQDLVIRIAVASISKKHFNVRIAQCCAVFVFA